MPRSIKKRPANTTGFPQDTKEERIRRSGAISPGSHPEMEDIKPGLRNPLSHIGRMLRGGNKVSDDYDNMVASSRGWRAYMQGSPSKTKRKLAIKMGSR